MWQFISNNFLYMWPAMMGAVVFIFLELLHRKKRKSEYDWDPIDQAELDRYMQRELSPAEIGLLYERYIGYLYERDGLSVDYNGATQGFEDLGRDLIVKKGRETLLIQAKYWAKDKLIHEKFIFQLFGSLEHYKRQNNTSLVKARFYTTATFSPGAREAASLLGIEMRNEKLDRFYPMIKCNVSGITKDRIYHLPTDEFYDQIKIESDKGEFFAKTVKEATSKGFRRARKYRKAG